MRERMELTFQVAMRTLVTLSGSNSRWCSVPDVQGSAHPAADVELVDGGDRACGDLLLVLAARARRLAPGTPIRLLASDPAAPLDLPAWCHLTGHDYRGSGLVGGRAYYDILTSRSARATRPADAWRLAPGPTSEHPPAERNSP